VRRGEFSEKSPGELIDIGNGNIAFLPAPLPPQIEYHEELINNLTTATLEIGELKGTLQQLANPYLLLRPFQLREAIASSQIEGTQAELEQLLLFEAAENPPAPSSELKEVSNYAKALTYAVSQPPDRNVSVSLIREIHQLLLNGVRGQDRGVGQFRNSQVYIGGQGVGLAAARFVPPPADAVPTLLNDLEKFMNEESSIPALIRLALAHYQFETIHPFSDGNGRVGRLLIPLLLVRWSVLLHPSLYLSDFFNEYRSFYIDGLWRVSALGDWQGWIDFFVNAVRFQAAETNRKTRDLLTLREEYRKSYQSSRSSAGLLGLIDRLFTFPATNITTIERELEVTYPTASSWIRTLERDGLLTEVTGQKKNRLYVANAIFAKLNEAPFYVREQDQLGDQDGR
jgi:Fic family protein